MDAKTVIRTGVVVALIGIVGVLLEKIVWQTADTYPAFLAGHRAVNTLQRVDSFSARDARTVWRALMILMTFMTMQMWRLRRTGRLSGV